jgi:putative transposase
MSQRDIEYRLEKALGQFVLSKSAGSELTETLTQEYAACRSRDLSGDEVAYLLMDAVYEPLRRWGSKTGVFCVWALCVAGRKVRLSLSTANSESSESVLEVVRDLVKRGLPTPVTIPTDGAMGLTKASDASWPKALRIRGWCHQRQNLHQKIPPQAWPEFKALVMDLRDAPTVAAAEQRRQASVSRYQRDFPAACRCLLDDAEASLNPLYVPQRHQP